MNGILKRKVFFVRIRFTSPLSILSGEDEWTDSDILKDCDGTPFVPGSSLAGSMRAYLESEMAWHWMKIKSQKQAANMIWKFWKEVQKVISIWNLQ